MQIKLADIREADARFLEVNVAPVGWETTIINGEPDDEDGTKVPHKSCDIWNVTIDIDSGRILDWPKGTTAKINYKISDRGSYFLLNVNKDTLYARENFYVPKMLYPAGGCGDDYINMVIDGKGYIQDWKPNLDNFLNEIAFL